MRRIFIALIASGLLLVSGVAASAKLDSSNGPHQTQNQEQSDKKATAKPAAEPLTVETKPVERVTGLAAPEAKPAATTTTSAATTQGQCGFQGEQTGEHDDAACNDQKEQAGVNESKTEANDKTDLSAKDSGQQGNDQQDNSQD